MKEKSILLITPPLCQLNTAYPATAYLKGFLKSNGFLNIFQIDLGIELINQLFSSESLQKIFNFIDGLEKKQFGKNAKFIFENREQYLSTIDSTIAFLQNKQPNLAYRICNRSFLPEAVHFNDLPDLEWSFGALGIADKAKFFATLYIEDLGDFITELIDSDFGFIKYAEKIAMSARSFDAIEQKLHSANTFIDNLYLEIFETFIKTKKPEIVAFTIPFPGNLYSALKCGQWIKKNASHIKIIFGGGFVNTELRQLSDDRIFQYCDYICLDDGQLPILKVIQNICSVDTKLKRTFVLDETQQVVLKNDSKENDLAFKDLPAPDFTDLPFDKYLSVIDMANPMHRLWTDGRWNKMMLAHGCYWHGCAFCDTSLDYICRFEQAPANILVNHIEKIIEQTGETGFHFVDEAAPPNVLRQLANELINRKINITWWTNIRFEKTFTAELCELLSKSGCIAVTGGLETASDKLLKSMNKGVTIKQAAQTCKNFVESGIMIHTYLMYGFAGQSEQETIDSLEIVRQFFDNGLIQSAYWHKFTLTVHSPVAQNPAQFGIDILTKSTGTFANNDLLHDDPAAGKNDRMTEGLKKAIYNFMHGIGTEFRLQEWFNFKIPKTTVTPNLIEKYLAL